MEIEPFIVLMPNKPLGDNRFVITPKSIYKQVVGYLKEKLPGHEFEASQQSPFAFVLEPDKTKHLTEEEGKNTLSIHFPSKDDKVLTIKSVSKEFTETTFKYLQRISKAFTPQDYSVIPCDGFILVLQYEQFNAYMKTLIREYETIVFHEEYDALPKEYNKMPLTTIPEG